MKIAFSKPTADDAEQRALFNRFHDAGYHGLQLKAGQYLPYVDDPAAFREHWGGDTGCTSALIAGGTLDEDGTARLRAIVSFAEAVQSERIVFCHGIGRNGVTDDDLARFARTLSGLGREAADRGVALSLHHHYDQPVMHRRDFDVFFDAADHDTVHLTVDTGHLAKSGITDIAGVVTDFASVIDNVHVKDYADGTIPRHVQQSSPRGEFRLLGQGVLDLEAFFKALHDVGYDNWLCIDEESGAGLVEVLDSSMAYLQARLPAGYRH